MAHNTLPKAQADQFAYDSLNDWQWSAKLILDQYIENYAAKALEINKKLVVVDLFSGSGTIEYKSENYVSPSRIASTLEGVEKVILLEADADKFDALEARIGADKGSGEHVLLPSDPNLQLDHLKSLLAKYINNEDYLILCLSMPNNVDLHFQSVAELVAENVDFVFVHSLPEYAVRGPRAYINKNLERITEYVDLVVWAAILDQPQYDIDSLTRLFADLYYKQMNELGYPEPEWRHVIKFENRTGEFFINYFTHQKFAHDMYITANQVLESQLKLLV